MFRSAGLLWRVHPWMWALLFTSCLLGALYVVTVPGESEGIVRINSAQASLPGRPDVSKTVELPHNLETESREWWDGARYDIPLSDEVLKTGASDQRHALLLPRVGTRFRVLINGHEIYEYGWRRLNNETVLSSSTPHYVLLPSDFLNEETPGNHLVIEVQGQRLKRSGLWPLEIGDSRKIYQKFRLLDFMQVTTTWMIGLVSLLVGTLSLIIWLLFRERLFALIFVTGVAHAARSYFLAVTESPASYDVHFMLSRLSLGVHIVFFCLMIESLFGGNYPIVRRLAWAALLALFPSVFLSVALHDYNFATYWDVGIVLVALWIVVRIIGEHLVRRTFTRAQGFISVVTIFVLITGVRDILVVQFNFPGVGDIRWMSAAGMATMLALGWVLLDRSLGWAAEVHRLNATLDHRIKEKESEMRKVFSSLEKAKMRQAADYERRRLMREMHDGLGSQLVQTLNYLQNSGPQVDTGQLSEMVVQSLTDLRLTLDSLEQQDGDIPAILGTLRGRIGPSLEAAGIRLHWDVEDVAPLKHIDARGVMHVFRCLQEIFANAVKHAGASNIYVRSWQDEAGVHIGVEDDGVGAGTRPMSLFSGGLGLRNIAARASKIGAVVRIYDVNPGFGIELVFGYDGAMPDLENDWQPTNWSTTLAPD